MRAFKERVSDFVNSAIQARLDEAEGIKRENQGLHMILTGNPGTGKTTVAQKLAEIYFNAGLIRKNKIVKVERADLVGQYVGHTEAIVRQKLAEAEGGILFIDEAYGLVSDRRSGDFGHHVIDGLLTALTENKCVIVAAGYPDRMSEFLRTNEGLNRRFDHKIQLPDYEPEELYQIFKNKCEETGLIVEEGVDQRLMPFFEDARRRPNFGNAGFAETVFRNVMLVRDRYLSGLFSDRQKQERKLIKVSYIEDALRNL
jgi:SpoVK/Ycf46/Vps4 family AAA+-type ATPase